MGGGNVEGIAASPRAFSLGRYWLLAVGFWLSPRAAGKSLGVKDHTWTSAAELSCLVSTSRSSPFAFSGEWLSAGFPLVGRTPWSARVPLDPLYAKRENSPVTEKADEGVGRGPGGPPYQRKLLRTSGDFQSHSQPIGKPHISLGFRERRRGSDRLRPPLQIGRSGEKCMTPSRRRTQPKAKSQEQDGGAG